MSEVEKVKKNDFIELRYTGYANGELFDSNVPENLTKIHPEAKPKKLVVLVGQNLVVPGLDKALEGKEVGKDYEIEINPKEGFGDRKRELVKTIPLKIFTEKKIAPQAGMTFALDQNLVKILSVNGARVIVDFNNPLSGKTLKYEFKILRKVIEEKEKVGFLFEIFFKNVPDFEIEKEKVIVKGPKEIEIVIKAFSDKFKDFLGKPLEFKLEETKKN